MSSTKTSTNTSTPLYTYQHLMTLPNTSTRIRYLSSLKVPNKEISLILNIRYQHVRNVLHTILKKS